jgi:hypothetical protein
MLNEAEKRKVDDLYTLAMSLLSQKADAECGPDATVDEKKQFFRNEVEFHAKMQDVDTEVLHAAIKNWFSPPSERVDLIN